MDVVTYFCARWYHQGKFLGAVKVRYVLTCAAVVKNDVLYLYGGIATFNVPNLTVKSENNTLGYSKFYQHLDRVLGRLSTEFPCDSERTL
jgi:hypothetical protein